MSFVGAVRAPQPIPDPNLLNPAVGQRQSTPTFFLRATPPIIRALNVGGTNFNSGMVSIPAVFPAAQLPIGLIVSRAIRPATASGRVELSGLVHARTLGGPSVNPTFSLVSLVHVRGVSEIVVTTSTPPDPPDPPDPPTPTSSITLSGGPRTIRSVRRRNVRHR